MEYIYNSPFTIVAVLMMLFLLFVKVKHHPPIVQDENLQKFLQLVSLALMLTGAIGTAVVLIKSYPWATVDIYISLFFFGLFVTGLTAETNPTGKKVKAIETKGKKKTSGKKKK